MEETTLTDNQQFRRDENFTTLYSNNVRFEASVWDLKLIFGQLDQSTNPAAVDQHTAIAISWMQAKLMAYFLEVNIAVHETDNGYIKMPHSVIPPGFDPATVNDTLKPVWEWLSLLHKRFFPEVYQQPSPANTEKP